MIANPEHFRTIEVNTLDRLTKYWPFFLEGLGKLNVLMPTQVSKEKLFKLLVDIVAGSFEAAKALVVLDCRSQPLFFIIAFDNTSVYRDNKSMLVFAAYSNKKSKRVARFGLECIEEWAKGLGYSEIQANSSRINGAGFRLFEQIFKFERRSVLFFKKL